MRWVDAKRKINRFLFPQKSMAGMFKAMFMEGLEKDCPLSWKEEKNAVIKAVRFSYKDYADGAKTKVTVPFRIRMLEKYGKDLYRCPCCDNGITCPPWRNADHLRYTGQVGRKTKTFQTQYCTFLIHLRHPRSQWLDPGHAIKSTPRKMGRGRYAQMLGKSLKSHQKPEQPAPEIHRPVYNST